MVHHLFIVTTSWNVKITRQAITTQEDNLNAHQVESHFRTEIFYYTLYYTKCSEQRLLQDPIIVLICLRHFDHIPLEDIDGRTKRVG